MYVQRYISKYLKDLWIYMEKYLFSSPFKKKKKKGLMLSCLRTDVPVFSCFKLALPERYFSRDEEKDILMHFEIKVLTSNKYLSI